MIKTDSEGNEEWTQTYGGDNSDYGLNNLKETPDGGYIILGASQSFGMHGGAWVIKTDSNGETCDYSADGNCFESESKWSKTYDIYPANIDNSNYEGYILGGSADNSAVLIKIDNQGNEEWTQIFNGYDQPRATQSTNDGGYFIAGWIDTNGGNHDLFLIKTDSEGNEEWVQTYGGDAKEVLYSGLQTSHDNGYLLSGYSYSYVEDTFYPNAYIIKINSQGNQEWMLDIGEEGVMETATTIIQRLDAGSVYLAGIAYSGFLNSKIIKVGSGWTEWSIDLPFQQIQYINTSSDYGYIIVGNDSENIILSKLEPEIWGCMDPEFDTYNPDANLHSSFDCYDCEEGAAIIDYECYNQNDLDVLQDFIDLNPQVYGQNIGEEGLLDFGSQFWTVDGTNKRLYSFGTTYTINGIEVIPESIENLTSLYGLNLRFQDITYLPEEICNLSELEALSVDFNEITSLPDCMFDGDFFDILDDVDISDNLISTLPVSPDELCDLIGNSFLRIENNYLCEEFNVDCSQAYYNHYHFGEQSQSNCCEGPNGEENWTECIAGCTNPDASNYDETANVDDGSCCIELWGECYNIEETTDLDLPCCELSGEIPPEIGNLINLNRISISYNELSGEIPPEIGSLTNLSYLNLRSNQLSGEIPPEIGNLTNLDTLYLTENQLTGIPTEIGNLTNLTYMRLSENNLTGEIPSEIGNLTNLENLWLEVNQLSGEIPSEIGNLTNLEKLSLSNNHLTGYIPSEIGNLSDLNGLWLDGNALSGEIPLEIGNSENLQYLDLRGNQLSGEIPIEIIVGRNGTLYLGGNQLSGEIPIEICDFEEAGGAINLSSNQLCPPYPDCLTEEDIGYQDISGCDLYSGPTWYVSTDGTDAEGYGSEEYPFASIQYAIDSASDGDEVHVSAGTYYENIVITDKTISLLGENRETTIIDGGGYGNVVQIEEDALGDGYTTLSYFTITNGALPNNNGGGIRCWGNVILTNLIITNNISRYGGGIYLQYNGGHDEAGELLEERPTPILDNIIVENNTAIDEGGGIAANYSSPIINNSIIRNNSALIGGGGLRFNQSSTIIKNTLISGNSSTAHGGGIYFYSQSNQYEHESAQLINVTIVDNETTTGETSQDIDGGYFGGGIFCRYGSSPIITNSIMYNNHPQSIMVQPTGAAAGQIVITINYSNIEGGEGGIVTEVNDGDNAIVHWNEGSIDETPQFNEDFTLQPTSPCIDAGDPSSDLDPDGTVADMGAYYFHQEQGDLNLDSNIDVLDILILVNCIIDGDCSSNSDLNEDGNNDILDIVTLVQIILG